MPSFSLSVAITNMTLLSYFSAVYTIFQGSYFFFKTVRVIQVILSLKSVKNKNLWQYDMNINFLINRMLWQ